jgi:hypothetical protein
MGGSIVHKLVLTVLVVAAALLFAGQSAKADWLCGTNQCVWVNKDIDEPAFTASWGPPVMPGCFWKQGFFGRWKMVCPNMH